MSDKKKKKKEKIASRPKEKPDKPDIHDEGSYTTGLRVEVKKGGPLKYAVGGSLSVSADKPAWMRNR